VKARAGVSNSMGGDGQQTAFSWTRGGGPNPFRRARASGAARFLLLRVSIGGGGFDVKHQPQNLPRGPSSWGGGTGKPLGAGRTTKTREPPRCVRKKQNKKPSLVAAGRGSPGPQLLAGCCRGTLGGGPINGPGGRMQIVVEYLKNPQSMNAARLPHQGGRVILRFTR